MKEYLAFVDEIGRTTTGDYIYRLDFTENTDVVWGDYFNVSPAIVVSNLEPDENCLSSRAYANFPRKMETAKQSYCFSMQDCFDGIVSLMFSDIDDETLELDNKAVSFSFGEEFESVIDKLSRLNIEIYDKKSAIDNSDNEIDAIINGE